MNEQKKLLRMIQNYSFAVTEAVLYLDTHPHCHQALRFLNKHSKLYHDTVDVYESKYGPLTMYSTSCCNSWRWVEEPWPWEIC